MKPHNTKVSQQRDVTEKKTFTGKRDLIAKKSHSKEISLQKHVRAKRSQSKEISEQRNVIAKNSHKKERARTQVSFSHLQLSVLFTDV